MYLVVGLGNPDKKYLNTFHNMGFMCVDKLAEKLNAEFSKVECKSVTAHARVNGEKVIIAKPVTYMNLSGEALIELTNKYKIEKGKLIVVYDDVDVNMGCLRIRKEGSAGSHNGMKSIVHLLGTTDFPRIRIGIGKDTPMALIDFVLSQVQESDHEQLAPVFDCASNALLEFVSGYDLDKIMQKHNIK